MKRPVLLICLVTQNEFTLVRIYKKGGAAIHTVKKHFFLIDGVRSVNEVIKKSDKRKCSIPRVSVKNALSQEILLEKLVKLPAFAPKPVCRFTFNGKAVIGRLEKRTDSILFIRHQFGRKMTEYPERLLENISILKY
ncbi:hypothetical protein [Bacillus sp. OV322]|uniref:hypothetical protein n=1 Tax=Bacillus sp. OV322 TaxID=1882764 RepID=UPI00114D40DE|nr:hypothetical protein [Bacillus sp. OV322]